MLTHRHIARRKSVAWQVAAVGLLAAAGVAATPPVSRFFSPSTGQKIQTEIKLPEPGPNPVANLALANAVSALEKLGNPLVPALVVNDPTPGIDSGPVVTPGPVAAATGEWVYVGYLASPTSRSALVRVDNDQKIVYVGQESSGQKIKAIEPTFIEIESGGTTRKLDLAARTMLYPTDGPRRPGMPAAARPGTPGGPMVMTQPIPNNFEQAKQAALEAARRAQMNPAAAPPPRVDEKAMEANREATLISAKTLTDPGASDRMRLSALRQLGISAGMPVEDAIARMKSHGGEINEEVMKSSIELLERNAAGKIEEEGDE